MSINESIVLRAETAAETAKVGLSLANSLYRRPLVILLEGELGAGKTTFVQGFAEGLGIKESVASPTYALEQRYGDDLLSHIDLYRLNAKQADEFVMTLDPFPGIRVIEWPERTDIADWDIRVQITEEKKGRRLQIDCRDIAIPSDDEIAAWLKETFVSDHIIRHMQKVAEAAELTCVSLLKQGRFVRQKAIRAAALTHDLLRFVDFKTLSGDEHYQPTPEETAQWTALKQKYGEPHEIAAEKFIIDKGYPEIARIVRPHRGYSDKPEDNPSTMDQIVLAYADKRAMFDKFATLDERFDDFIKRYSKGEFTDYAKKWLKQMKEFEKILFPEGVSF